MRRFWTALAVSFFALGLLAGCNDYNNSVQYNTGATLTNISPSGMPAGPAPANAAQCQNSANGPTFPCFTLYVIASAFNPFVTTGTPPVVQWSGQKLPTTLIDSTNLSAQVPYSYLKNSGSVDVNVYQPQNQGSGYNGLSNALTFIIYGAPNPVPTLSSVTPASAAYCDSTSKPCAGVPITLAGTNFIPVSQNGGSSVTFTGQATYGQETAITVTSITSTELKATIPGALLCATDIAQINVLNPPSAICLLNCPNLGGGDTKDPPNNTTQTFSITNSSPANTCPAYVPPTTVVEAAAISQDGRYVAYASTQDGTSQVLLRDTCLGATKDCVASTRTVSVAPDGSTAGNGDSRNVSITPDGRYVAFSSAATNLVRNAPLGRQVYVRDTCNGASGACTAITQAISVDESGKTYGSAALLPSLSSSGRFVAFVVEAPRQSSLAKQIVVRDTCLGATNCTPSVIRASSIAADASLIAEETPAINQDGRYVAYTASQNGNWQIVQSDTCLGVPDRCSPSTRTVSLAADGGAGDEASHNPVMTPDGRYVAFSSAANNLVENAPLGRQVYLRDTCAGIASGCKTGTTLVSTDQDGKLSGTEAILPSLSGTGRYVAFLAVTANQAGNSGSDVSNSGLRQVFVRDLCLGTPNCTAALVRVSLQPGDAPATGAKPSGPALAALGKQVALVDGKGATVFTPTIAVDDRTLVAIPSGTK